MFWASVLLTFLSHNSGSLGQYVVTQPPSVNVPLAQNVQITCSGDNIGGKYVQWYQQISGKAPVLIIYSNSNRPAGISDRFSGSNSGNTATLSIARAQADDEASYYCQVWDNNAAVFGAGTVLSILNGSPVAPSVRLYAPSEEEIKKQKKATLVCLMDGFNPGVVKVDWEADGTPITSGVQTSKPTKQGDKYLASSYLSLTAAEWERHNTYNCKVTHEGNIIKKTVQRS